MMIRLRNNKLSIGGITFIFVLLLSACSPKDQLLGVWAEEGGDIHLRFLTGDTITQRAYFEENILSLSGSYEIINDSQIRIEFTDGDWRGLKSGLYDYSIDGNDLKLGDLNLVRQPDVYNLE